MVRLNLADINVTGAPTQNSQRSSQLRMKGTFSKGSDVSQLDVGVGKGLHAQ